MSADAGNDTTDRDIDALLGDPSKRAAILQRLGQLDNLGVVSHLTPSGTNGGGDLPTSSGSVPTFSGTFQAPYGAFPHPATWYPFSPFPPMPQLLFTWPSLPQQSSNPQTTQASARNNEVTVERPSGQHVADSADQDDMVEEGQSDSDQESDVVSLLDDIEAEQFREFDPEVKDPKSWQPPSTVIKYLDKHFNKTLSETNRQAILSEYPVPDCAAVKAPKLDTEVTEQLKSKGKDPRFGAERNLYKIQEQLLEVTGPLTSLWADLMRPDVDLTKEQIVHQLQRALVLVGSTSHAINVERRKVAWARINPKLKSLAEEEYKGRESNLFGPGFLEKASKKLEAEKALAKVSQDNSGGSRKRTYEDDPKDLRRFLAKGSVWQQGETMPEQAIQSPEQAIQSPIQKLAQEAIQCQPEILRISSPYLQSRPLQPQAGRVSTCLHRRQEITSDPWVLQVVRGYQIEWIREPFQISPAITSMKSTEAFQLMEEEVQSLLVKGAVVVTPPPPPPPARTNL